MAVPGPFLDARFTQAPTIVRMGTPFTSFTTPLAINIPTATVGDNTIIPGVAGQVIRVFRMFFNVSGATNLVIKNGTAGVALSGSLTFATGGGFTQDLTGDAWYTCSVGANFVFNSSAAVNIGGIVYYVQS